ncbi:hypothetical protein FOA52_012701 [Chlamydomonas sp. UWO 241]|nr:hypothetical protein FOA52_012701 [Chlamydomonas sp. UWO 241]
MLPAALSCLRAAGPATLNRASSLALSRSMSAAAASDKITVTVQEFKAHKIEPPSNVVETSLTELREMYTLMVRMRRMEIAGDMMYKAKLIKGFCHLYDGQEAVLTGIEAGITKKDSIITSYRDHCQFISRGGSIEQVMAELFGRATGATKGVGGSMHMYNKKANFYGGNGIVGAQVPLGAGIALAHKYRKEPNICIAMYGDGAANQGQIYEAFNMSALWNIPCVFVCENNHYGMGTAQWRGSKNSSFFTRGDYIPGVQADGMDALAVKRVTEFAKAYALENGPIILELDTYRYHGHSMSDPGSTYRSRDEINTMRQERDPIERIKKLLLTNGVEAAELKRIDKDVKKEVDAAVEAAKAAPIPPEHWRHRNIYADPTNCSLRLIDGTYITPDYDPTYST